MSKRASRSYFFVPLAAMLVAVVPCGCQPTPEVSASGNALDRSLAVWALGTARELDGVYGADCEDRSGGWIVGMDGAQQGSGQALSVIAGNSLCRLSLTAVRFGATPDTAVSYFADFPIELSASFLDQGVTFRRAPGGAAQFFANARLTPDATFARGFSIEVAYSDVPALVAADDGVNYPVASSAATATGLTASDYSVAAVTLRTSVDANLVVVAVDGGIILRHGTIPGDSYVVSAEPLGPAPAYADVDRSYRARPPTALVDPNPQIAGSDMLLLGTPLTTGAMRSLIIGRTQAGLHAYQIFEIHFTPPSG